MSLLVWTRGRWRLLIRCFLGILFLVSGAAKLLGAEFSIEGFARWGYPSWLRVVVGACELAGGVGLLLPQLHLAASLGLAALMLGAAATHLKTPGEAPLALLPVVFLGLLLAHTRRPHSVAKEPR